MAHENGETYIEGKSKYVNRDTVGSDRGRQLGPSHVSLGAAVKANKLRSKRTKKGKITGKEFLTGPLAEQDKKDVARYKAKKAKLAQELDRGLSK